MKVITHKPSGGGKTAGESEQIMKRVFFIGSGYECVKFVYVEADTPAQAIRAAENLYKDNGWNFPYNEIEVDKYDF